MAWYQVALKKEAFRLISQWETFFLTRFGTAWHSELEPSVSAKNKKAPQ